MMVKMIARLLVLALLFIVGCRSSSDEPAANTAAEAGQAVGDVESSLNAVEIVTATPDPTSGSTASAQSEPQSDDATSSASSSEAVASSAMNAVSATNSTASNDSQPQVAESAPPAAPQAVGIMPDRISIPSIELDTPVVELSWHPVQDDDGRIFSEWDVADQAAGWHKNSSLLNENGNVVLSGHNNILGAVFRELDQLKRGDSAVLWADGEEHRYLVDKVMIVPEKYATQEQRETNAAWIGHFDDDRLTLVSCWPRDDNSHRIIVVAYSEESQVSLSE